MSAHRFPATRAASRASAAALIALASAIAGCSHRSTGADGTEAGPGATSALLAPPGGGLGLRSGRFYPLRVGTHWDWRIHVVNQITTDAGPQPPDTTTQPWSAEIVGTATAGTHDYFIQSEYDPRVDLLPPPTGYLMREDRLGLYELNAPTGPSGMAEGEAATAPAGSDLAAYVDRAVADPAQHAAYIRAAAQVARKLSVIQLVSGLGRRRRTGADAGETTDLSYPLQAGASWIQLDSPRIVRTVIGHGVIRVPLGTLSGWRILIRSELVGPNDRAEIWYSPLGRLRLRFHFEGDAVDNTGTVIGRVATDSDQSLVDVRIVSPSIYPSLEAASAR
jgi:hypothetical protein